MHDHPSELHMAAYAKLRGLQQLGDNWNSYGAPPPSEVAVELATSLLVAAIKATLSPSRILASPEGGVAFVYFGGDRKADIEIFNDGDILVGKYGREEPQIVEFALGPDRASRILGEVSDWLHS